VEPILVKYRHIFHEEGSNGFRGTDLVEHKIVTGNAKPIRKPPYRVPFALRKEMENQVETILRKGVIEASSSPWSTPVILVPKKCLDGKPKYRFCVDFRALNSVTQFDTYPLPVFEGTYSTLHGSKYFSVIDCYSGFWQIKIAEEDKMKTAFSTPSGHHHFHRLPYGLSNSQASFQRLKNVVLRDLTGTECWMFLDDLIVFSDTIEEHTRRLEHVLQRFERANVQLQPAKCVFAQTIVQYLGYTVSQDGITTSPDKVKAVRQYPTPRNVKDIRFYLGFYRRLIPKFAEIAKPLTEITRKNVQFSWEGRQQAAFEKLETCSDQVLAYPDFQSQFILTTDASKIAVAAILSQVQNGVERPIAFASRQMNKAEQNYTASEAETLAVTWATKHFRCYLYGEKFVVRTDHSALTYIHKFADNNSRLMRWSLRLAEFDFDVENRPGAKIRHVDALSRHVQAITTEQIISKDLVRAEQKRDNFCSTLQVGKIKGISEYFMMRRESSTGDERTGNINWLERS